MKIFAVDDSATMRKIVSLALKGAGHEIIEAEHGKDALAKLAGTTADCIILDINMPEMNGLEFLAERKKSPLHLENTRHSTDDPGRVGHEGPGFGARCQRLPRETLPEGRPPRLREEAPRLGREAASVAVRRSEAGISGPASL